MILTVKQAVGDFIVFKLFKVCRIIKENYATVFVIWRGGWRIATFNFDITYPNFCSRVNFARSANL